jgi:hypothetical protein
MLTAALLGIALGVGTAMLLRRKPSGYRAAAGLAMDAARGTARSARRRGRAAWDDATDVDVERQLRKYLSRARSSIDDMVESELQQLRRAIRKQRKRIGV